MAIKKEYTIGIDVGGTKIAGILFDGKNVVADYVLATPQDSLDHFFIMLQAVIEPLLEKANSSGCSEKVSRISALTEFFFMPKETRTFRANRRSYGSFFM